jgi:hypothetical protein
MCCAALTDRRHGQDLGRAHAQQGGGAVSRLDRRKARTRAALDDSLRRKYLDPVCG